MIGMNIAKKTANKFIHTLIRYSFFRFIFVGIISNIVNFSFFLLLSDRGFSLAIVVIIPYFLGLLISYFLGNLWVFKKRDVTNYLYLKKFIIVYFIGAIIMIWMVYILKVDFHLRSEFAWFFSACVVVITNYLGLKEWVFKTQEVSMINKFRILEKLYFVQDSISWFISSLNPILIHNLEKYYILKKVHYLSAIENVEGDYLEFGVFTGSSFCHSIRCYKSISQKYTNLHTRFFGFDSFGGFGELNQSENHPFYKDEIFEVDFNRVNKRVIRASRGVESKLIPGYFCDTLRNKASYYGINKAKIIFIDSDTYSSAWEALNFCLPTLQEGTYVIMDDFYSYKGNKSKGVAGAFYKFIDAHDLVPRSVFSYGMGGVVFIL